MRVDGSKVEALFIEKLNRFVGVVLLQGVSTAVHIPNSGRLAELLLPGALVILRVSDNPMRKYRYSLIMVEANGTLVSVDSLLPNKLAVDALRRKSEIFRRGKAQKLLFYDFIRPEVRYQASRFDIGLGDDEEIKYYLEIKGVTLAENSKAMFPDAPTERGARHLKELAAAKREGFGAGVFFVIQREDVEAFVPNDEMDPLFGQTLRNAVQQGVDVFAMKCRVEPQKIAFLEEVEVIL